MRRCTHLMTPSANTVSSLAYENCHHPLWSAVPLSSISLPALDAASLQTKIGEYWQACCLVFKQWGIFLVIVMWFFFKPFDLFLAWPRYGQKKRWNYLNPLQLVEICFIGLHMVCFCKYSICTSKILYCSLVGCDALVYQYPYRFFYLLFLSLKIIQLILLYFARFFFICQPVIGSHTIRYLETLLLNEYRFRTITSFWWIGSFIIIRYTMET